MAKFFLVLCFCASVQLVCCQFGFFNQQERKSPLSFAKNLPGSIRETIGGILRPHHRPVVNDNNQNSRPHNFQQRPVSFPTANPEEAPNYHPNHEVNQGSGQVNTQAPVFQGQDSPGQVNFVNPGSQNTQSGQGTVSNAQDGQNTQPGQDAVNVVINEENSQGSQDAQPGPGTVNFVNNDGSTGSYDGPNDPVDFENKFQGQESTTLDTVSRNNFNFAPVPQFRATCKTINGGTGSCISLYSCQPFLKVVQDAKTNPAAVRMLRQAHCGFDGSNPKVCCPLPGIPTAAPETTTSTTTTTTTTTSTTTTPAPAPVASPKTIDADFLANLPVPPVCGVSNTSLSRVVGGVNAKLGAFPWMALLGYKRAEDTRWLCGGSLISSRHVLTAAHCIHNHENDLYLVRLGELDLAREDEGATPVDVLIKEKIKHEQYDPKAFTHDIAIILLERDVEFTDLIKPICIPTNSELRARTFEDYNPLIAGWGDTEFRGPAATHLQVLQLPVVSNDFCAQAYSAYKKQHIDEKVLCAGFKQGGKDACQGDSGGPLMQPIWNAQDLKTHMYQIGVVSFGKKCAEAGFPGVYSRVTFFAPWIEEKVTGVATSR